MKLLYQAILTKLSELVDNDTIKYRNIWNNQHQRILEDKPDFYPFNFPAVFVEILNPVNIIQLGVDETGRNGQLYDKLVVRFHILHQLFDSVDGDMDKNLDVYDTKAALNDIFNKWQTGGSSTFMRKSEEQDFDHGNISHYTQDYLTSFIEYPADISIIALPIDITIQNNLN